jgi:thioredoxin reductase
MRVDEALILGAGPHAFALTCRLLQESDKFVESKDASVPLQEMQVRIFDRHGAWFTQFKHHFDSLEIESMRSPVSFHLDLIDPEGLLNFAKETNRLDEIKDTGAFQQVKSRSKTRVQGLVRDRKIELSHHSKKLFEIPSSKLFLDFLDHLVEQYGLARVVEKQEVVRIQFCRESRIFCVFTANGETFHFRKLIYAGGVSHTPRVPEKFWDWYAHYPVFHSWDILQAGSEKSFNCSMFENQRVLIVGGGLTGAQISVLAKKRGAKEVTMVVQHHLKIKHFDFDEAWIAPSKSGGEMSLYKRMLSWKTSLNIRTNHRSASITPAIEKDMKMLGVKVLDHSTVSEISRPESTQELKIELKETKECLKANLVIFATGSDWSVRGNRLLFNLADEFDLPTNSGGIPVLNHDLSWGDLPIFLSSAYACLQVGPPALNLLGAVVISKKIVDGILLRSSEE